MVIYGVALLAACVIAGLALGEFLGWLLGIDANVGGVGVAMLLLIVLSHKLRQWGALGPISEQGIAFWNALYIPIVVAMAASQNVASAVYGGPVALLAGGLAVAACFALVPVLCWFGSSAGDKSKVETAEKTDG